MKIHSPSQEVSHASGHAHVFSESVVGEWQLGRSLRPARCGEPLLQYRVAPTGTPTNFDYLLHTPVDPKSESALSLLQLEFHISQLVNSPHLLPVLDVHLENPPYFIVTPHLRGSTLRTVLQTRGKLEIYHALWLLRQTAQAVAALHSHGWSMPNLQAENLQIEPDGHLTLSAVGHVRRMKTDTENATHTYNDTCRLASLFIEMTTGGWKNHAGYHQASSSQSRGQNDEAAASVLAILREILNAATISDRHSVQSLVERLVRLEIGRLSRPA